MGYLQQVHSSLGLAFSIVGLALSIPHTFLFKQHSRFLDHLQLIYLYCIIFIEKEQIIFGNHLRVSWAAFIPNFLTFCTEGDIVCLLGFALSFNICLIGTLLILAVIVLFQKRRKPNITYEPVYSFFKGFFKWTYIPLTVYPLSYLIAESQNGTNQNLIPSIIILAFAVLFPILQLIYYKVIQTQKDNIWVKWFEFFSYARHFFIVLIFTLGFYFQTDKIIARYFVYVPFVVYTVIHLWKGIYMFKIVERILFGIGQCIGIVIFSLYIFDLDSIKDYELDFIGMAVILLLDMIIIISKTVGWICYGKELGIVINDNENKQDENPQNLDTKRSNYKDRSQIQVIQVGQQFNIKKRNKYDESEDLQNSRDQIMVNSPSKKTTGRRR